MAETKLTIVPASVASGTTPTTEILTAGEAIAAGKLVYKKASDRKAYLADADATTVAANIESDDLYGVCIVGGASGASITVQKTGDYTVGATVVPGTMYALSAETSAAGEICTLASLAATDYVSVLGLAISTSQIHLMIYPSGVQVPA